MPYDANLLHRELNSLCDTVLPKVLSEGQVGVGCLCASSPTIFEGTTRTGRPFYVIYRNGTLRIGVAPVGGTPDQAMIVAVDRRADGFHWENDEEAISLGISRLYRTQLSVTTDPDKITFTEVVTACPQFIFM